MSATIPPAPPPTAVAATGGRGERRVRWLRARVADVRRETPRVRSLMLDVPEWPGHTAGQHVDVRLRAEDGYEARRSYSIASAPEAGRTGRVTLTVERLRDGEVSPYLVEEVRVGDALHLRGPVGGYFTWRVEDGGPLFLVAGGSGVVPLMSMLRHREAAGSHVPTRLLYSARTPDDVIYRTELERLTSHDPTLEVVYTITRATLPPWAPYGRRIDQAMLADVAFPPAQRPHVFVCGPTVLVEGVAASCVTLGHERSRVKTERFGPSGT
jgi:ferredoxin-NADP reductase